MMDSYMFVPQTVVDGVVSRVKHVIGGSDLNNTQGDFPGRPIDSMVELEASINKRVDLVEFMRLLRYLRSQKLPMVQQEPCLDISFSNVTLPKGHVSLIGIRITVTGAANISRYYSSNALETLPSNAVKVIRKTRVRGFSQLDIPKYDVRVNLRLEESCAMSAFDTKTIRTTPKMFRLKNRVSFMSKDGMFRYDLSKVYMSEGTSQHMSSSGLSQASERYEVEIELLQPSVIQSTRSLLKKSNNTPISSPEKIANALLCHAGLIQCIMTDSPAVTSSSDQSSVLNEYSKLNGSMKFGGAEPVTLERKHVIAPELLPPNAKTIQQGFSVTAKYDGDRHLLFLSPPDGKVFLLARSNNMTSVKYFGYSVAELSGTLIDGEYLSDQGVYAAFDAYFLKGQNIKSLELQKRLEILENSIVPYLNESDTLSITTKDFKFGDGETIFEACKEILESIDVGDVSFETDGLIFTPTGPLVTADDPDVRTVFLKWKPPEQNSIDFLVRFEETSDTKTVMTLYCGHKQTKHASISPIDYLTDGGQALRNAMKKSRYVAKRFEPAPVMTVFHNEVGSPVPRCKNGDVIDSLLIVECAYSMNDSSWVPLRIRWDKVKDMYISKRITANNYETAMSVWRSITQPVLRDVIEGKDPVDESYIDNDDDVYYKREEASDISGSRNMRQFHNSIVKLCSLLGYAVHATNKESHTISILDIGCGKGGDIPKYLQLGIGRVLGVDNSVTNIRDVTDGAYARLDELTSNRKRDTDYVFLSLDASKPFFEKADCISACSTDEDREAAKVLWSDANESNTGDVKRWSNFARKQPFDIVSLMFDIHYFFLSESSFNTLISNIVSFTDSGSVVVGVCMDGDIVRSMINQKGGNDGIIRGKSSKGNIVYQIEKKYNDESKSPYGNMIGVYVDSINQVIDEPLVSMTELQNKFESNGFETIKIENLRNVYNLALEDIHRYTSFVPRITAAKTTSMVETLTNMSVMEKECSFMNTCFVFRKL